MFAHRIGIRFAARVSVILLALSSAIHAQDVPACPAGDHLDVSAWVESRIQAILAAQVQQKNNTNQTEMPSVAGDSPSLVDESSASDLVGVALNLIGVSSGSTENTSTAATVSAYALKSAFGGHDPLEPEYYNANAAARRLSFTLGAEFPQDGDNQQTERGVIVGGKYLLINERDITRDEDFGQRVESMLEEVGQGVVAAVEDPIVESALEQALCETDDGHFVDAAAIDDATLRAIDEVIARKASAALSYQQRAADLVNEVNERPQVAVEFLTNQRQGSATSTYKGALTADLGWSYDLGFADSIALTFNGAYAYDEKSGAEDDSQGGIAAAKLRFFQAATELDRRVPWTLSLATDGAWKTNATPQYRVQAALSIALWDGVELPLSVSWANQTQFLDEEQVIGNIGFTVDTAKIIAGLR
jgi:hypothetical protein